MSELVKEYLTKHPQMPSNTLAKMIYDENWQLFKDKEQVRTQIRYLRGAKGVKSLHELADKSFVDIKPLYKYNLPETDVRQFTPYILPKSADNILILSDIHFPYHDPRAIEVALDWGVEHGINTILLNGDILDFYQLSKFIKDPSVKNIRDEIEVAKQFFKGLNEQLPNVKVFYKMGNHEERFENYLKAKAPELFHIDEFRLDVILHLREYGIEYIGDKRKVMAGKLPILHGHEVSFSSSVNPARGLYLKTKESAVCSHLHRTSEHSDTNISDELSSTWSIGCLCDLHPEYAPYNSWNHGFARVKVSTDGSFQVFNARMYDYRIL